MSEANPGQFTALYPNLLSSSGLHAEDMMMGFAIARRKTRVTALISTASQVLSVVSPAERAERAKSRDPGATDRELR